ncbi:MAG TPA: PPC domain-containing protein, partial [Myxococcota bacterium]
FDLAHATSSDLDIEVLEQRGSSGVYRSIASGVALAGTLDDVSGTTTAAVRLIVRISEFGVPTAGLAYALGIELSTPTGTCVNDRFDTWRGTDDDGTRTFNNNARTDSSTTDLITTVPTPLAFPENLTAQQICTADVDVYALALTQGQRFTVTASYTHSTSADIDIRVFGPDDSNTPADSDAQVDLLSCSTCAGTSGTETFSFTATRTGTHFVEVFEYENDGTNSYDLSVQLN